MPPVNQTRLTEKNDSAGKFPAERNSDIVTLSIKRRAAEAERIVKWDTEWNKLIAFH